LYRVRHALPSTACAVALHEPRAAAEEAERQRDRKGEGRRQKAVREADDA
jgi:hypothetical protein